MKAVLVKEFGGPEKLVVEEVPSPTPNDDQVLIDVHYAGVNFPDTLIIEGLYQFKPEFPFSPGGEVAGIIREVGKNVKNFKPGDRVISGCGWGGFAEQVASFASNTHILPDEVDFKEGSVLLQTYATTYHALVDRANVKNGETILILGAAGGTGTSAIQLAKAFGLTVIASASTESKLDFCKEQGADHTILSTDPDFRNTLKKLSKGIDVVYDPVGGSLSETAFRSLNSNGRHLVIGFASGDIPKLAWNLPLLKSASIVGVFWGGFFREYPGKNAQNVERLLQMLKSGSINPQIQSTFELNSSSTALNIILSQQISGKVVIEVS